MARFSENANKRSLISAVLDDFLQSVLDNREDGCYGGQDGYKRSHTANLYSHSGAAINNHSIGNPIASIIQTAFASSGYHISQVRVQYKLDRKNDLMASGQRNIEFQLDTILDAEELKAALYKARTPACVAA